MVFKFLGAIIQSNIQNNYMVSLIVSDVMLSQCKDIIEAYQLLDPMFSLQSSGSDPIDSGIFIGTLHVRDKIQDFIEKV